MIVYLYVVSCSRVTLRNPTSENNKGRKPIGLEMNKAMGQFLVVWSFGERLRQLAWKRWMDPSGANNNFEPNPKESPEQSEINLSEIIPTFTCSICRDLFVDAHTLKDCLHSCLLASELTYFVVIFCLEFVACASWHISNHLGTALFAKPISVLNRSIQSSLFRHILIEFARDDQFLWGFFANPSFLLDAIHSYRLWQIKLGEEFHRLRIVNLEVRLNQQANLDVSSLESKFSSVLFPLQPVTWSPIIPRRSFLAARLTVFHLSHFAGKQTFTEVNTYSHPVCSLTFLRGTWKKRVSFRLISLGHLFFHMFLSENYSLVLFHFIFKRS